MSTNISSLDARRKANQYLTLYLGILLGADDPQFVSADKPVWRFTCYLNLLGQKTPVGMIDVDSSSGEVVSLSADAIEKMQAKARDYANRNAFIGPVKQ